jgi:hypothetical protein
MTKLTLKVPSFLRFTGAPRIQVGGHHIDPQSELNYLSDRCLEDIGLARRGDRNAPRPFWLPY